MIIMAAERNDIDQIRDALAGYLLRMSLLRVNYAKFILPEGADDLKASTLAALNDELGRYIHPRMPHMNLAAHEWLPVHSKIFTDVCRAEGQQLAHETVSSKRMIQLQRGWKQLTPEKRKAATKEMLKIIKGMLGLEDWPVRLEFMTGKQMGSMAKNLINVNENSLEYFSYVYETLMHELAHIRQDFYLSKIIPERMAQITGDFLGSKFGAVTEINRSLPGMTIFHRYENERKLTPDEIAEFKQAIIKGMGLQSESRVFRLLAAINTEDRYYICARDSLHGREHKMNPEQEYFAQIAEAEASYISASAILELDRLINGNDFSWQHEHHSTRRVKQISANQRA